MRDLEVVKEINKNLIRDFGYFESRIPLFRLVYANHDLTEVRQGEYNEFYGDIFLRKTIGTEKTEKYNYLSNVWVLERQFGFNDESVKQGDGYEPIFVFYVPRTQQYLVPRYDVAKIYSLGSLVAVPRKNAKQLISDERIHKDRVIEKRVEVMEQESTWQMNLFRNREAVILDGKSDLPSSPNLRGEK